MSLVSPSTSAEAADRGDGARTAFPASAASVALGALILFGTCGQQQAATIAAASASRADVAAALAVADHGDTVVIPKGTATWTMSVIVNKAITLKGAGVGETIIVEQLSTDIPMIAFETAAGKAYRVTGIEFHNGTRTTRFNAGIINLEGSSSAVRVDHCKFYELRNISVRFGGYVRGVVDHNQFTADDNTQLIYIWHQSWAGGVWGDKSWSEEIDWGGADAVYIEDNTFVGNDESAGVTDTYGGARLVCRYNHLANGTIASHGTGDGAGRNRGPSQWEIYGNTWSTSPSTSKNAAHIRGGSVRFFLNTINGHTKGLTYHHYRLFSTKGKFGNADGVNAFDIPDLSDGASTPGGAGDGVFASGLAGAGSADLSLVVPGAGWTPGQWVGYIVRVPVASAHPEGIFSSVVTANTSDRITVEASHQPPIEKPFVAGEAFELRRILLALDMIGAGRCDLLTDTSVDPTPVNLNQTREPCYAFLNTINGARHLPTAQAGIVENYHYFNQANAFNGTSGVGVGTFAQMNAITPTLLYVGFWVTDQGEWNSTNGATPDGRLYVWDGNSWELKYTPYAYPHPLVDGSAEPPRAPSNLRVVGNP